MHGLLFCIHRIMHVSGRAVHAFCITALCEYVHKVGSIREETACKNWVYYKINPVNKIKIPPWGATDGALTPMAGLQ